MRTNVLNDLSNVVKKGTSRVQVGYKVEEETLAGSWSQRGQISEEGAIEHPLSTHSAPFGIRWKPAGNQVETLTTPRFFARIAAMVTLLLTLACGNVWGETEDIDVKTKGTTSTTAYTGSSLTSMSSISFTATGGSASIAAASGSYTQFTTGTTTGVKITFTPASGVTVSALEFTLSSGNEKGSFTYSSTNAVLTNSNKTHTISGLSLSSAFDIYCHLVSGTSSQSIKVTNIKVTYSSASCTPCTFKSGDKVYFKDQSSNFDFGALWKVSSGNVYAYFWNDTENAWSSYGTPVDGDWNAANTIYELTVPGSGKEYQHVIFTRGNNNTCFDCSSTWDKTTNQEPCEGKNLFYVSKDKYADHIYYGSWGNFTPASKTVYFDNRNVTDWTTAYVRIGHGTNNAAWGTMTKVAGTRNLYSQTTSKYISHTDFSIANKAGWTGSNHIDQPEKTYTDGSWSGSSYKMTKQTNYQQYAIEDDIYLCPKATSVLEHECQFYQVTNENSTTSSRIDEYTTALALPQYKVVSTTDHCTVTMEQYTNDALTTSSALSSGSNVDPTRYVGVTVTPSEGYEFGSVTLTENAYEQHTAAAAGVTGKYAIMANCTIAAVCTPCTYTITYKDGGNTAFSGVHIGTQPTSHTYGTATALKKASKAGYVFGGWYTTSACTGDAVTSLGATAYTANITLYAKWTAMSMVNLVKGTFYGASAMVPAGVTVSSTEQAYPGVSTDQRFNMLGSSTSDAMASKTMSSLSLTNASAVTEYLDFKGSASVSSYIPSTKAVQFKVPAAGKLEIWANSGIYLSNGSSETSVSVSDNYATVTVSAGTYYLYAKNTSRKLYGIRFKATHSVSAVTSTGNNTKGSVSADPTTVVEGGTSTITAVPAAGYQVTNWAVSGTGSTISPSGSSSSTTTTLTMGTADATVTVTFGDASYSVTHTLTNVTKSSGGTTATHGTDYTAVFAADDGYNQPNSITVTIGGNSTTSGTEYTWNKATGTVVIDGDYITGAIVITVTGTAACTEPAAPTISGTTSYTVGETMTLTATCASGADGSTTYTWYKGATFAGASQVQAAATGSSGYTFTKTFAADDAGTYWCEASNGTGCEAHNSVGYAVSAVTYTVTYNYNGATSGASPASATGASVTLPTPTRTSYVLDGWYTTAGIKVGDGGDTYSPTADITLYARWETACAGGEGVEVRFLASNKNDAGNNFASMSTSSNTTQLVGGGLAKLIAIGNADLDNSSSDKKIGYRFDNRCEFIFKFTATTALDIYITATGSSSRTCRLASFSSDKALADIVSSDHSSKTTVSTNVSASGSTLGGITSGNASVSSGVVTITNSGGIKISYTSLPAGYYVFYGGSSTMHVSGFDSSTGGGSGTCYHVYYHGNGAESGFVSDTTSYANSATATILDYNDSRYPLTKAGYTFQGWATSAGGSVAKNAGDEVTISSADVHYYAVWAEVVPCTPVAAPTALTCSGHTSNSLTFTWTKADHASTYTAKLYSDAECTSQVASQDLGDVATVTFSTLSAETTYYCKVQSHGDGSTYCTAGGTTAAQSGTTDAACTAHGLAYATGAVAKNVGDAAFTNTLTNPNSLTVTYTSSNTSAATVNATSGMVTIEGAGETTITATWAGDATYCAGTATYTLTVSSDCTPQSLSKVSATKGTSGTVTGYNDEQYAGDAVVKLYDSSPQSASLPGVGSVDGYKMGDAGSSIVFATLKGTSFQAGDKVRIGITKKNDTRTVDASKDILTIYYGTSKSDATALHTITGVTGAGFYEYTLTLADVTAIGSKKGIGLFRESDNGENPYVYSVEIIGCREWAVCTAPDAVAAGSVTGEGATFTITDALNTNNYEIYYSTSSTAPTAETSATVSGISTKSRAVTGLTAETTYYYWVRSNCGGATKSSWVAGTPTTFTTEAAAATNSVTYNGNGSTGGSAPTDATAYEEGDIVTVLGNTGSLVKAGQTFLGWSTSATASSGTFYPAGYKFYMPNAAVTLYAVWGSAAEEKYYYGSITITAGALTPGSTGTKGFFTNSGGTIATSSAISLSSTPSETGYYYESSTLTHTALNKSSNWNTGSTSKRTIRAFKFKSGSSYTLALGSKTATSIMFYGRCGSASKTMTVGGVGYESPSTSDQFFSHEYTKSGNFTGNVTITQDGDFYGILVVTVSTGAGSNHTVTFNMNGKGSAIEPIANVPDGSKIGAPVPSPTAVGAEFGGWYEEAGCTSEWDFATGTITADKTLYAKWTTCAPSISGQPSGNTYTQDAAATALSVTASGEGLNYQWYTSEEAGADISGSSAIPGATSASYTPSTSLLGTIYYFCVVSNTCGNAVSNKAEITVNDGRPIPTAVWTIEEPEEGGKGFTFSIEVNKGDGTNWDGELLASMLTLSDNAILDASIVVDNTNKTISGTYGVKAGSSSPVTFYLLLPATTTQSATRLDHDRTFTPCAGGAGDNYTVRVRKDYEKDASNNYRWVTPGAGEITYAVSSSISSAKAASTVASVFDSIMPNDKQYVWVKTYESNTKTIRLYVETSGANVSVNTLYKNTVYATAADKDIVSSDDYSVSYDGSGSAENTGAKGTHYMDITFDSPLDANDIICIKFSSSKVRAYGAILTTVGDGGDQTTVLTWSNGQVSGATLVKREDAADFAITAVRDATALKSLGLISYTSSNTAIATIDGATGLVHIADNIDFGSDESKTTTITATLAASGCYKKAVITYILQVNKHVCEDAPGTITYVDHGCSGMDLTLEDYEEGATIQWYKNGATISGATSATYNATVAGEYYAVTHKTCDITSTNSVTLEAATATAEKIVDSWYVKNGRRTPDIALVQTTGATSFTVTSGGTITEIGGCTFELKKDGIIYLHGQKEDGSAPSDMTAGDMTITITVSGCAGALSGLDITIHKQAETAKPSVAFVVDGTLRKDGGTATSVSEAKTSDRPLWTYLSSTFTLTGCNVYWSVDSKELREYYSQFDAILITDDPNTQTKGTGDVPYVKAFGTMVDVRPILTLEAFVGRYSDGGWHVYNADPTSPDPRQVEMKLECKNHDIFKGLDPNASDNVRVETDAYDNEYWYVIMVDTTVAPYHNTSKDYKALPALQGFDKKKFDHMLGVGTIADETLQAGVERQEEPAARMMILGIQNEAMAALTNEGKQIIKNAIEYLLKTNMEDVNDCANYFTDATGDHMWNTAANWLPSSKVPDFETRVRILKPVVIPDGYHAIVARVDIATSGKSKWIDDDCNGSVTINPQGALIVGGKIRRADAPHFGIDDLEPTQNNDLIVKSATTATHYQGALIFDNSDGDTHAVVEMWNPSYWEVVNGKKKKYWSYVAVPIQEADIPNFFWYGFTYLYNETSGWIKKGDGTSLYPFQGIGASLQTGNMETFYGPLATTESQDITLTKTDAAGQGMNLIGNSWTAPIQIANFDEDDFGDATPEVWVFNTGHTNDGHSTMTDGSSGTTTDGQWQTIPIGVAGLPGYTGLKVIPAMQAFEVNTTSETTLHLDYDRLVRAGRENLNEPMRAPRRGSAAKQLEATMRVRVSGELTHTDVYLLKDARFSNGFDNGWDGHYLYGDDRSSMLYAISEEEGALAFLAQPEIEGTQLGFAPSRKDTEYTFSFSYDGEEELYLNDLKLKESTLIDAENTYLFTYEEGDAVNRFYISATPFEKPNIATGTETIGHPEKAQKVMYKDHIYIIRGGKVYDVVGKMVK